MQPVVMPLSNIHAMSSANFVPLQSLAQVRPPDWTLTVFALMCSRA